jgi:hypothetical protein
MGFFKDLRDLRKTTKDIEQEQFGTTNPFKIGLQSLSELGEEVGKLADYEAGTHDVAADGLRGEATVTSVQDTGVQVNNMPMLDVGLLVSLEGRDPYAAAAHQVVQRSAVPRVQPGMKVPVKVDPEHPEVVALDL